MIQGQFSIFLHKNIHFGYSLESTRRSSFNKHLNIMDIWHIMSKSSSEPHHEKTCLGHMQTTKVISTFVVRCLDSIMSLVSIFAVS